MLPRVRAPAHNPLPWLLALVLGSPVHGGCGDDGEAAPPHPVEARPRAEGASGEDVAAPWAERLAAPTVPDLLTALAQPHAEVREHLGPHRLEVTTDFELAAPDPPAEAVPELDAPIVRDQAVHDQLVLRWDAAPESGVRLSLSQANDHDRGRDVVLLGETIHVRHAHRPWVHYPRDSDLIEQWLDDAQRSVHDAVQLAAPRLALRATPLPNAGLEGGPAVEIALELAEREDPSLVAAGPTQGWRTSAEIQAVEGTLVLDASSGAWLSAAIDVRYRLPGADERAQQGQLTLQAQVAPGSPGPIEAPEGSRPLPSRLRYDDEQRRLLDGLAAP